MNPLSIRLFQVEDVRKDFPILQTQVYGHPLVYLDNAATSQKPNIVLETLMQYYKEENANVHRGVHYLSQVATERYEDARRTIQRFLGAPTEREIIFTRGATEGINLVAATYGRTHVHAGDEVLISGLEHHSNIVPWQLLCEERGATLRVIPISDSGELLLEEYERLLTEKTKIVAVTHVSNALGTVNPIRQIIERAHRHGIPVMVDGAQAVSHMRVDVHALDCDFYVLSAHKLFGPTGFGVLYGKEQLLEAMPPYQAGGDMIRSVTFEKTIFNDIPYKFEAGTPDISGAIAFGAALNYITALDWNGVEQHERHVLHYATEQLSTVAGLRIIGTAKEKAGVISFVMEGVHPHDLGTILDQEGVAIRTGHHCAQPVMDRFCIPATARASFALYNTVEEVDALIRALGKVKEVFHV